MTYWRDDGTRLESPATEAARHARTLRARDHHTFGPMPRRTPTGGTPWELGLAAAPVDPSWNVVERRIYWGGRLERRRRLVDDRLAALWGWLRKRVR